MVADDDGPLIAALIYPTGEGAVIGRIAAAAQATGLRVAGMIQKDERRPERRRCDMTLRDLTSGREIAISEDRGREARGCTLDHGALEAAAGLIEAALDAGGPLDLLILSKFGKREIEGHGFRQVVERAVDRGVPVLVGVGADHVDGFRAFAGGLERLFESEAAALALIADLAAKRTAPAV